jgi:hypothetical protein
MTSQERCLKYAACLGDHTGDDFQQEVCRVLRKSFDDFQTIPSDPGGDGALDGLSHDATHVYCCYGPEHQTAMNVTAADLRKKIVDKFSSDLRRLLELDKALSHKENDVLTDILGATGKRICAIRLILNKFSDNKLIGLLKKAFVALKRNSKCRWIDPTCSLVIWGPGDLVDVVVIDEHALLRVEHPTLDKLFRLADAESPPKAALDVTDLDKKFNAIPIQQGRESTIQSLRETARKSWSKSLSLEETMIDKLPSVHERVEKIRQEVVAAIELESLGASESDAPKMLAKAKDLFYARLTESLEATMSAENRRALADWETARLTGECPLEWRSKI